MFKILIPGATIEQLIRIQALYEFSADEVMRSHLADVLRTSIRSNVDVFNRMNAEGKMSEAVRTVFAKEIEEQTNLFKEEAVIKMVESDVSAKNIADWLNLSLDKVFEIAAKNGFTVLHL